MSLSLANYVSDPAIVRTDEHDGVITVLHEKRMAGISYPQGLLSRIRLNAGIPNWRATNQWSGVR